MNSEYILVVEDELALRETLEYNLVRQGYRVITVEDGAAAVEFARAERPSLILLDLMLPLMDGFEVCRILRQETNVPILMLTARDAEVDRVIGLEMGADDYLTKPFSMRELIARVKALLRRVRFDHEDAEVEETAGESLTFGDLAINPSRREATIQAQPLNLKPKEYDLLLYFARHRGQVLSREIILNRVWNWTYQGASRTVDVHVRWLREKIEPVPDRPVRIITVRGAGYRFEG